MIFQLGRVVRRQSKERRMAAQILESGKADLSREMAETNKISIKLGNERNPLTGSHPKPFSVQEVQ